MPSSFEQGSRTPSRLSPRYRSRSRNRRLRPSANRFLRLENLEPRQLMDSSWQNPFNPRDINGDGVVVPQDILVAINELNNRQFIDSQGVLPDRSQFPTAPFYDFTGDGKLVPLDVLPIINRYNDDEVPPTIVVGLTQDSAPGGTNTDLLTRDARISGRITDDTGVSRLVIKVDGGADRTVTVAPDGTFQFDPSLAADGTEDGEHDIQVVATDGRRNVSAPVDFSFQLDTVGLDAPTSLDLDADSDTGTSPTDGITKDDTPTIHGDAVSGSVIQILSGSLLVGQTTANSPWTVTTAPLEDGEQTLSVISLDAAGNPSSAAEITVTIDTTAPAAPTALRLTAETDTGSSQTDGITKDKTPTLAGTAEDGVAVSVFIDEQFAGTAGGGAWQFSPTELVDGVLNVTATAEDAAGNVSVASAIFRLTVDTQAPQPPSNLRLVAASDTGQSSTDGITRETAPTYTADTEAGALVRLFVDDELVASANSPVLLTVSDPLAEGQHTVFATTEDLAGNLSGQTSSIVTVIDTTPPAAATLDLSATSDTDTPGDQTTSAGRVTLVGSAGAKSQILLTGIGLSALASQSGDFQLTGVPLEVGDNELTVETLDEAGNTTSAQVTITRNDVAASLDPVLRWNQTVLDAIKRDASTPPQASRFLAMVQLAVFDAVNNIDGTPSYLVRLAPPSGASAEAAVSGAAHQVLKYAFPGQTSWFDAALTDALSSIPDGAAKTDGVAFGRSIADAVIAVRNQDGWDDFVNYVPTTNPGDWQPTAPMFDVALMPQWAQLDPFAMTTSDQFLPAAPPELNSVEYATAVNELKGLGRNLGSTRTADQTAIARFWADGPGTITPAGHWNDIAQDIASDRHNSLADNARLFAVLNVALADAGISAWNTKFHYNFWRPIDAIQQAAEDGNNQTTADEAWEPLLITPPFPDYTSGHSTYSGAASQVLTHAFGDNVNFTTKSPGFVQADGVTPVERSFTSFEQAANEAGRSRIYGGIHYEFSNQAGLTSGRSLGDFVWDSFSSATDDQPPRVIILNLQSGAIESSNVTVPGRVFDNVSGVQSLEVSTDGGQYSAVQVGSDGSFTVTTTLATDGSADGLHHLQFRAVDFRGNTATTSDLAWTLDTRVPTISITTTPEDGLLAGTVNGTGSAISFLKYHIDGGDDVTIPLPDANGSFSISADLSRLIPGPHTVTVSATDSAGLTHSTDESFNLESRIAFRVTDHTPVSGAEDIGSTYRPQVFFSRPVDTDTLTEDNFFATDSTGDRVPAIVVPAQDGSFAWLFFVDPLPGASTITVHVDGNTIAAEDDGAGLDADDDGVSGGSLTYSFSTVRLSPLPGTSLSGKVVDPGVDLKPMTFDDIRPGPDGVLHTPDDRFLLPIAGVKVFVLGLEDDFVLTDANGNFHFDSVPGGNVKLAVDGRTATNEPAGIYFPEMVMDLNIQVGAANTVMGTMGTLEEMLANLDRPEVYLPRLQTDILQSVSDSQDTLITVDGTAAPNLSDEQRQFLTLEVQPQSLIGPDGQPISNGQVGISTVPPELVREMLPPGLLQHTFDITIQAPAAATFSIPLTLTLPNVFNSPPGTKLNFLSFDHTTGRLVIEGTGTVSADGLSVVTDAGTGITKPGWHGFTPPVTCGKSGGPPPTPRQDTFTVDEHEPSAIFLHDDHTHTGVVEIEFKAPKKKDPPPPPANGCPPREPTDKDDPPTEVTIEVQGSLDAFMKKTGDLPLSSASFSLPAGSPTKKFKMDAKSLEEIFGEGGFQKLTRDQLYGSTIRVTKIDGPANARTKTIDTYVVYKWVDVIDVVEAKDKKGTTAVFLRTFADGNFARSKSISTSVPTASPTTFEGTGGKPFEYLAAPRGIGATRWFFQPAASDAGLNPVTDDVKIKVAVPFGNGTKEVIVNQANPLKVSGLATSVTKVGVNLTGYKAHLTSVIKALRKSGDGQVFYRFADGNTIVASDKFKEAFAGFMPDDRNPGADGILRTDDDTWDGGDLDDRVETEAESLFDAITLDYSGLSRAITIQKENAGADVTMQWQDKGKGLNGNADRYDYDEDLFRTYVGTQGRTDPVNNHTFNLDVSEAAQQWFLSEKINDRKSNSGDFGITNKINYTSAAITFAENVANTVSHEIGHTFGLNESYITAALAAGDGPFGTAACKRLAPTELGGICLPYTDLMNNSRKTDVDREFKATTLGLLKAAVGLSPNGELRLSNELTLWRDIFNLNVNHKRVNGVDEEGEPAVNPEIVLVLNDIERFGTGGEEFDLGAVAADGLGNAAVTSHFVLTNWGVAPLTINSVTLANGNRGISLVDAQSVAGQVIDPQESVELTVSFDPGSIGQFEDTLQISSNAGFSPDFSLLLKGIGQSASPVARVELVASNNLGGLRAVGGTSQIAELATITNDGVAPLILNQIRVTDGAGRFSLVGIESLPDQLALGESFTFGVAFDPDRVGLDRATIEILTNDPVTPSKEIGVVGTGLDEVVFPQWGGDFVAMETSPGLDTAPLRVVSDAGGNFQLVIQPDQPYHVAIFDPITGLIAHGYGTTPQAGGSLDLTADLVFGASVAPDSDFDGLPDDIELAIGTSTSTLDTDGDILPDGVEIEQGWDPLDSRPIPLGLIAQMPLRGDANEVVLEGSFTDADGQTAYVATGSYGLGIVNTSKFYGPIILGQIDLAGTATDVSIDSRLQLAVVATNQGGVQVVDISDPRDPQLVSTLAPLSSQVEVLDGVAYVNVGTKLQSFDILNGVMIHELDLAGGNITAIARERSMLYTLDADHLLRAVDISSQTMVRRDSLALPVSATKLFVANGVAYIGDAAAGGFATVDVSNANDFNLIAGPSELTVVGTDVVATGSGQALSIGSIGGVNKLQLLDISSLSDTGQITDTFADLPGTLRDVAIGGGFGYVAAGSAGLLTINFLGLDTDGLDPIVDVGTSVNDQDLDRPGVQVLEGTTVPLLVSIRDDVQVRNVELLIDGQVVRNDVSFPFDFSAVALTSAANGQVRVQIRATDTGGNVGFSRELILEEVADTTDPTIIGTSPNDGATRGQRFRTVQIEFSEPMDASTLTAANLELRGPGNSVIAPIDIQIRNDDKFVQLTYSTLDAGSHQITVKAAAVRDRAGNALGANDVTTSFTVSAQAISWVNELGGDWNDPNNWDQGVVPGPFDHVVIDVPGNVTVTYSGGESQIASLYSSNRFTLAGGRLSVIETVKVDNAFLIDGGTLEGATVLAGVDGQGILFSADDDNRLDGVTVNANLDLTREEAVVRIANGLTLNGTADVWGSLARILIEGSQTITAGRFVLNTDQDFFFGMYGGFAAATAGASLTFGDDVTVEGHGTLGVDGFFSIFGGNYLFPFFKVINQGTIVANDHGQPLTITAGEFQNEGSLKVRDAGRLLIDGMSGNLNSVEILHPDSQLILRGDGYVVNDGLTVSNASSVTLGGEWTNAAGSAIAVTNAKIILGTGDHLWSNSGTIDLTESFVEIGGKMTRQSLDGVDRQGGELQFLGSLDNAGQSLALDTFASDWSSGRIRGGTVVAANASPIQLPVNPNGTQWKLEDVAIDADIVVPPGVTLQLEGDWENNQTITIDGGTLKLGGEFSAAELGDIDVLNGGSVEITGKYENTGATLHIDDGFDGWSLAGGTIHGGNVTFGDPGVHRLFASASGGTLDGVTVQGDLELSDESATLTIAGGTTFEAAHLQGEESRLLFAPNQILTGSVLFEKGDCPQFFCSEERSVELLGPNASLTIGATGVIRTVENFAGTARLNEVNSTSGGVVENLGAILLDPETRFFLSVAELRNNGSITVGTDADLSITGVTGNLNDLSAADGSGSITLDGHDFTISQDFQVSNLTLAGTWTNDADIVVDGSTLSLNFGNSDTPARWHNTGSIDASNASIFIAGTYAKSDLDGITTGSLNSLGGTLDNANSTLEIEELLADWSSPFFFQEQLTVQGGTVTAANNQWVMSPTDDVRLDGVILQADVTIPPGARLEMAGSWTNSGAIDVLGSLRLGGDVTTADLGTIENTSGSVVLNAILDNAGDHLTLDNQTGVWTFGNATIQGGTLTVGDGSKFPVEGSAILDGVTVDGDLRIKDPIAVCCGQPSLTLLNGTTFDTIHMDAFGAALRIGENQTITGEVLLKGLGNQRISSLDPADTLTIAATGAIRTADGYAGFAQIGNSGFAPPFINVPTARIVNEGTIESNHPGNALLIIPSEMVNHGTLGVSHGGSLSVVAIKGDVNTLAFGQDGGTIQLFGSDFNLNEPVDVPAQSLLSLQGDWINSAGITSEDATLVLGGHSAAFGDIDATDSIVRLTGEFTLADVASIQRTGGAFELVGTLDNSNQTIALDTFANDWRFRGGEIVGGTISTTTNNFALAANSELILEDVELTGTVTIPAGTKLTLRGNWTNSGKIVVDGGDLVLDGRFDNSEMGDIQRDSGQVVLSGTLDNRGGTLTLDNSTGSWRIEAGEIQGGIVKLEDGQTLIATDFGGSLIGVEVQGDVVLSEDFASLFLADGTSFETAHLSGVTATLRFGPNETIRGDILFEGASSGGRFVHGEGFLTIDATAVIRTVTGFGGSANVGDGETWLVNDGAILSEVNSTTVFVEPRTLQSSGRMESSNGATLNIGAENWENTGLLKTTNATLELHGDYAISSIEGDRLERTGGTVNIGGWLNNVDSTLELNSTTGSWNVVGAEIYGGTYTASNGEQLIFDGDLSILNALTADGPLDISDAQVSIRNGLVLNDTAQVGGLDIEEIGRMAFRGTQTLSGTGEIVFGASEFNSVFLSNPNTTLTIGNGITIHGDQGQIGTDPFQFNPAANTSIINRGTINSEVDAITIGSQQNPEGSTFRNLGTLRVRNGASLTILNMVGSIGNISLPQSTPDGGTLSLNGANYVIDHPLVTRPGSTLQLFGSWTNVSGNQISVEDGELVLGAESDRWHNLGTISATDSDVILDGLFRATDLGTYNRIGTITTSLRGTLDNTNATLALNASTGSWTLNEGTVRGGTITQSAGAELILAPSLSGTLDGVTLSDDLLVQHDFELTIRNGLTLDSANLTLAAVDDICCEATVNFDGFQSVLGQGEIILNTNNFGNAGELNSFGDNPGLTIGPQVIVRGAGFIRGDGPITVQGTILANIPNETLQIEASPLTNEGTIRAENSARLELIDLANEADVEVAAGATLNLDGNWSNAGTITVTNAEVNLGGEFKTSELGSFDRNGGTVNLTGTLENTGATLALDPTTGSWNLRSGTIHGGAYSAAGGAKLVFTDFGGFLDGLTARGDLDLTQSGNAHILHGLTLDDSTILLGNSVGTTSGGLYFEDTSTLGGTGDVVFGKSPSNFLNTYNTTFDDVDAGTFTIGPNITIRGSAGFFSDSFFAGRIVNEGKISADDSGGATGFDYDRNFSGGFQSNSSTAVDVAGVAGAAPQAVYDTARSFNDFTYTFDGLAANTGFTLRLHFAEIFGVDLGDRMFNVAVNGASELTDYDVVAEAGGQNKAVVEEIAVTSDANGKIEVAFTFGNNNPIVNGLELKSGATVVQAIDAGQLAGGTITINPQFVNNGEVESRNGELLVINELVGNAEEMTLAGTGSRLDLSGTNYVLNKGLAIANGQTLNLNGSWSNTDILEIAGGTVNLGGNFSNSEVGTLDRSGGTVNLTGTLDNTGTTLALDATTGSWNLAGGTILGGDYTSSDGAVLALTDQGGNLNGITARGDLDGTKAANANAHVITGLTLDNSTIFLGNATGTKYGGLYFDDTTTLGGTGTVVFGKSSSNFMSTYNSDFLDPENGTFTIGSDIVVRGSSGFFSDAFFTGQIVNQGTILADDSGGTSSFDYDDHYDFGSPTNTDSVIDTAGVTDAAPQVVYQTARSFGDFTYTFAGLAANTAHTLRLHFAEILDQELGARVFDVDVNGITELDDFDIVSEAGAKNKAIVEDLAVTSDNDGKIVVEFKGSVNTPLVNALELKSGATRLQAIDAGQISGGTITIYSKFKNEGQVEVRSGETLNINNFGSPNAGLIHVGVGGVTSFSSDFTQGPDGIVAVDVGGISSGQFGTVTIAGTATLDGELQLAIVDGFVPAINDAFTPITFGGLNGQFANIATSGLPAGTAISETYNASDLTLTVVAALRARVVAPHGNFSSTNSPLDASALATILATAVLQWCQARSASACVQLADVQIVVANLGDDYLGLAAGNRIWIDDDAAGVGWFVDESPWEDSEFDGANSPSGYDLLSVVMHELGHLMGAPHSDGGVMDEWLNPATRRSVSHEELEEIFGGETNWMSE